MDIKSKRFTIEFKGAEFIFKYGTDRDAVEILRARKQGWFELLEYFSSRLIEVKGLTIDSKEASTKDLLDLPREVLSEIIDQWSSATIDALTKDGKKPTKKKKSTRKSKAA